MAILAGGGSFNLLEVNPGLVIWTLVTFLIVLTVLWLFAWKPILKALDERNERVENDLEQSRKMREEAESLLREYEDKLDHAKTEAHDLIDEGKKDAETAKNRILSEAQDEAAQIKNRTTNEIEQAKLKALDDLEQSVVDMTVSVISKILQKQISDEDHKQLIVQELEHIKKSRIQN